MQLQLRNGGRVKDKIKLDMGGYRVSAVGVQAFTLDLP